MPLAEILAALRRSLDARRCLPAACYTDPGFWREEVERVLRPGWHAVARHDELKDPGDYRSLDLFGEPLLLVRDEALRLRAFSRVCLHRAFPIATGEGNAKRFTCPYHRWSYDLDGRLRAAPLMDGVAGFDRDACRLPELPVETWQGFVLVSLDPRAAPLAPRVSELARALDPWKLGELRLADTLDYDSPWNWKVMAENFMESYHHLGPHVSTLHPLNPAQGTHAVELDGEFALLENPAVPGAAPFYVMQVFPTLLFALVRDAVPFANWYEMRIDGPDHFHLRIHTLLPAELARDPAAVAEYRSILRAIHAEDIPMCEGVQRGLASRVWQPGRLSRQEATLARFHRYLAERVGA